MLQIPLYNGKVGLFNGKVVGYTPADETPPAQLSITTGSPLPSVQVGQNISRQLQASGGSGAGTWSIVTNDGTQPVSISSSGLVTKNSPTAGTITFTVRYTDNVSANGHVDKAFQITVTAALPTPTITTASPLPGARIGASYSQPLQKSGGSGSGSWSKILGSGGIALNGVFTINPVPSANFSFTARFTDTNGAYDEKEFTVPVSSYDTITFCHKRNLKIDIIQTITIDESLDEGEEVSEDEPLKYNYNMNCLWITDIQRDELWSFLYAHRLRQPFLWYNPDRRETKKVKIISLDSEEQALNAGGFSFVLQHIEGDD